MRYEVFSPSDGRPIYRFPFAWLARLAAHLLNSRHTGGLDWAPTGEGWTR
jgi:hypothetical protein